MIFYVSYLLKIGQYSLWFFYFEKLYIYNIIFIYEKDIWIKGAYIDC